MSIDLGELQRLYKKAQAKHKVTCQILERASAAYTRAIDNRNLAKNELDTAHAAVLNGARDVTQG
jgi:hypothetical protein